LPVFKLSGSRFRVQGSKDRADDGNIKPSSIFYTTGIFALQELDPFVMFLAE
jgi:hypothetical protein